PAARQYSRAGKKLRIVHVVSSLLVGGMEQFVLRIADAQRAAGHEVFILSLRSGPLFERAQQLELPTTLLTSSYRIGRATAAIRFFGGVRPDIVNSHNPAAHAYAVLAKLRPRTTVVMTRHGQEVKYPLPSGLKLRFTDAIIAVSDAAAAAMRRTSPASA